MREITFNKPYKVSESDHNAYYKFIGETALSPDITAHDGLGL